jgi:hypothetical protein
MIFCFYTIVLDSAARPKGLRDITNQTPAAPSAFQRNQPVKTILKPTNVTTLPLARSAETTKAIASKPVISGSNSKQLQAPQIKPENKKQTPPRQQHQLIKTVPSITADPEEDPYADVEYMPPKSVTGMLFSRAP